jgi:hypothetical protein
MATLAIGLILFGAGGVGGTGAGAGGGGGLGVIGVLLEKRMTVSF